MGQDKSSKGEAAVEKLLKSTVLIIVPMSEPVRNGRNLTFTSFKVGTGVYLGTSDDDKPVILTNYHVVRGGYKVRVVFASEAPRHIGATFTEERIKEMYQTGSDIKLLARNHSKDMSLLEVEERFVRGAEPLTLAAQSVKPGADVHTMGCTPAAGLFSYTRGNVRAVGHREFEVFDEKNRRIQLLELLAIETTNPLNHGDSGGPLVNDALELVGIAQSKSRNASLVSLFVDRKEIAAYLDLNKINLKPVKGGNERAKQEGLGEPKRTVDEDAPENQIVRPAPPVPHAPKTCITFKLGYLYQHPDKSWTYEEFRDGKIQSGKLKVKVQKDDEMVFADEENKFSFRMSPKGLERSKDEKEWVLLDPKAAWNR